MPLLFRGERLMRFGQYGILINIRRQLFQIFQVICGRECRLPFATTVHILSIPDSADRFSHRSSSSVESLPR